MWLRAVEPHLWLLNINLSWKKAPLWEIWCLFVDTATLKKSKPGRERPQWSVVVSRNFQTRHIHGQTGGLWVIAHQSMTLITWILVSAEDLYVFHAVPGLVRIGHSILRIAYSISRLDVTQDDWTFLLFLCLFSVIRLGYWYISSFVYLGFSILN